jgi:cAMP-dependent protein kinase regulator
MKFSSQKNKKRQMAISAESLDPVKLKEQLKRLPMNQKSPIVSERLRNIIAQSQYLRCLDNDAKELLINVFVGPMEYETGQVIIAQGEEGEHFYLVDDGTIDVYISKADQPESLIHSYGIGDSFGELAILYNSPRAATCKARTACKLWSLDRKSFKTIVVGATLLKREKFVSFLRNVPILSSLTEFEVICLADAMNEEVYPDGAPVCTEGELGNYFYIIMKGKAVCTKKIKQEVKKDADAEEEEETVPNDVVGNLREGNYFGEVALLTSRPRQATVSAVGVLEVLSLDRATFNRLLGPLDDILRRNMDDYNKRVAQEI